MAGVIECGNCGSVFDATATRWLCPVCKHKESCCEGEPCPVPNGRAAAGDREA